MSKKAINDIGQFFITLTEAEVLFKRMKVDTSSTKDLIQALRVVSDVVRIGTVAEIPAIIDSGIGMWNTLLDKNPGFFRSLRQEEKEGGEKYSVMETVIALLNATTSITPLQGSEHGFDTGAFNEGLNTLISALEKFEKHQGSPVERAQNANAGHEVADVADFFRNITSSLRGDGEEVTTESLRNMTARIREGRC